MIGPARLRLVRTTGALAGLVCGLTACSEILGLRDIDEGPPFALDDAGRDRTSDGGAGVDVLVEVMTDSTGTTDADAGVDSGFCGAYAGALLCDDFDGQDYSSKWRAIVQSGVIRENHPGAAGAIGDLISNFDPIPSSGKAALAFDNLPAGKRSLRFSLWVPEDSYPATGLSVASLTDNTSGDGVKVFIASVGSSLKLSVRDTRDGGVEAPLPDLAYNKWYCIEVQVDGPGNISAWLGKSMSTGTATTATANGVATAEVGMTWTFGGNAGSITVHYDDVVIATGAVGCP